MDYTLETKKEIWNDKTGEYIEIGPDRDALGLIEIRSYTNDDKCAARLTFSKEQIKLVAQAILELLGE